MAFHQWPDQYCEKKNTTTGWSLLWQEKKTTLKEKVSPHVSHYWIFFFNTLKVSKHDVSKKQKQKEKHKKTVVCINEYFDYCMYYNVQYAELDTHQYFDSMNLQFNQETKRIFGFILATDASCRCKTPGLEVCPSVSVFALLKSEQVCKLCCLYYLRADVLTFQTATSYWFSLAGTPCTLSSIILHFIPGICRFAGSLSWFFFSHPHEMASPYLRENWRLKCSGFLSRCEINANCRCDTTPLFPLKKVKFRKLQEATSLRAEMSQNGIGVCFR